MSTLVLFILHYSNTETCGQRSYKNLFIFISSTSNEYFIIQFKQISSSQYCRNAIRSLAIIRTIIISFRYNCTKITSMLFYFIQYSCYVYTKFSVFCTFTCHLCTRNASMYAGCRLGVAYSVFLSMIITQSFLNYSVGTNLNYTG